MQELWSCDPATARRAATLAWPGGPGLVVCARAAAECALQLAVEGRCADRAAADVVAASVNDLLAHGAIPRALTALLGGPLGTADDLAAGIDRGCRAHAFARLLCAPAAGASSAVSVLAAGERVAELPGPAPGDVIYACQAPGLQGAGLEPALSLLAAEGALDRHADELGTSPRAVLTMQHKSFRHVVEAQLRAGAFHALLPVGDTGLLTTLAAALPPGTAAELDLAAWALPDLHRVLRQRSELADEEFARTFTLGIGMLLFVPPPSSEGVLAMLRAWHEPHVRIGAVVAGDRTVTVRTWPSREMARRSAGWST